MMNIFLGFEQANRYVISMPIIFSFAISSPHIICPSGNLNGEPLGYIAEEPRGILSTFSRQIFRTHRPFRALVLDLNGSPVLWVRDSIMDIPLRTECSSHAPHITDTSTVRVDQLSDVCPAPERPSGIQPRGRTGA